MNFSNLSLLGGDKVTRYGATVTIVNPILNAFKDGSGTILGLADKFSTVGFLANIQSPTIGYFSSSFKIILSKNNNDPFSINDAKAAIYAVTVAQSLSVQSMIDNIEDIVTFGAEIPQTTASYVADKADQFKNPKCGLMCKFGLFGIPPAAVYVGGGLAALYVLVQIANVKRTFFGGLGGFAHDVVGGPRRRRSGYRSRGKT